MDFETKLKYWKNNLIDLGKRNKLINYKDTKRSSLTIIEPSFIDFWNKIVIREEKIEFPLYKKYFDEDEEDDEENDNIEEYDFEGDVKVNQSVKELQKTLRNIKSKSKIYTEEQGINPLYLAFGFLNWTERENSDYVLSSPLVLVPIYIDVIDLTSPFSLKMRDDEIIINPALSYKMQTDYGINIYEENFELDIESYISKLKDKIKRMNWKIEEKISISMFSFYKINMYKDLEINKDLIENSPIVQALNGNTSLLQEIPDSINDINHDNERKVEDIYQILDADSSQLDAIEYAKNGISFVLQGPPGTGKSQTIANMIAELIASGKKVLFVSSKMAALDVVYRRLKNANLTDFCLSLHDPKTNKKDILNQLDSVFDLATYKYSITDEAKMKLEKLQLTRDYINEYNNELHKIRKPINKTIFHINGNLAQLDNVEDVIFDFDNISSVTQEQYNTIIHLLENYVRTLQNDTLSWKNNEWYGFKHNMLTNEIRHDIAYYANNYVLKLNYLKNDFRDLQYNLPINIEFKYNNKDAIIELLYEIDKDYCIPNEWIINDDLNKITDIANYENDILTSIKEKQDEINKALNDVEIYIKNDIENIDSDIKFLNDYIENDSILKRFSNYDNNEIDSEKNRLFQYIDEYNELKSKISNTYEESILNIDVKGILSRFKSEYSGLFRCFNSNYKKDEKVFLANKKTITKKVTYKEMIETLYILNDIEKLKEDKRYNFTLFEKIFGELYKQFDTNIDSLQYQVERYKNVFFIKSGLEEIKNELKKRNSEELLNNYFEKLYTGALTDWNSITNKINNFKKIKEISQSLNIKDIELKNIYEKNRDNHYIQKCIEKLNIDIENCKLEYNWFKNLFENDKDIDELTIEELINRINFCNENIDILEKYIDYKNAKDNCYDVGLKNFIEVVESNNYDKEKVVSIFKKRFYRLWLDEIENNVPNILNFRKEAFENNINQFKKLDKEQQEIAKNRILCKLVQNLPNLERLTNGDDEVSILKREINKNKRTMSLRKLFQTIPNLIVALKPCLMMSPLSVSIFLDSSKYKFDVVIFDEASQIKTEDAIGAICRGKQVIIVGDNKQLPPTNFFNVNASDISEFEEDDEYDDLGAYESILDEASLLPEKTLLWHYRSKNESLIAFSNAKFYRNKLITFPSCVEKSENNGVEFIYVENGRYDRGGRKGNVEEAKKVAQLVFEHFSTMPERSLGIIAFGEVQQYAIENEINKMRIERPDFEKYFSDDKVDSFFVKNLENVQGDERDSIIFSVGYAKDLNDRMNMNFGPLSRVGGERRLNVAITRAKYNIKLVSSILPTDINSEKISTEGPKLLKKYLEYAREGISVLENEIQINEENFFDSPFEESVYDFLTQKGYEVCTQVGCSGYRIDMAVKNPNNKDTFSIGIECDGAMYHSTRTARERDRLRQMVLEDMGWKIYRIWSTDWIKNPNKEKEELINAIEKSILSQNDSNNSSNQHYDFNQQDYISKKEKKNGIYDNPYDLELYDEFRYDFNTYKTLSLGKLIDIVIQKEYPIHFDEICRRCAYHLGYTSATKKVKEVIRSELDVNRLKYIVDDDFYMPLNAKIRPRCNLTYFDYSNLNYHSSFSISALQYIKYVPIKRSLKYVYKKELALIMKIVKSKSIGIDKESLFKETAKVLGCGTSGQNTLYLMAAYSYINEV